MSDEWLFGGSGSGEARCHVAHSDLLSWPDTRFTCIESKQLITHAKLHPFSTLVELKN